MTRLFSLWHTGVEISRAFSPESSSDSGNETNSSEMTETSELAAAQRHSESHLRMHVATTEGYQTLAEEKTEFITPCEGGAGGAGAAQSGPQEEEEEEAKSSSVSSSSQILHSDGGEMEPETMETKSLTGHFTKMHMGSVTSRQAGRQREAEGRMREGDPRQAGRQREAEGKMREGDPSDSSERSHDPHREELPHLVGKYNTFTVRDSHYMNQLDLGRTPLRERHQKWQRAHGNKMAESVSPDCVSDSHGGKQDSDERSQHLNAHLRSPFKDPHSTEDAHLQSNEQQQQQSKMPPSEQDVTTRLYEYHLSKRMSSIQSEGVHSLQSSQCSSLDAGCSTGSSSSSCVTPMDSPLCTAENTHLLSDSSLKGLGYMSAEEKAYGGPRGQGKAGHPIDPTLLRRIHAATSAEPGFGPGHTREGSHRMPKIKETTGTTNQAGVCL